MNYQIDLSQRVGRQLFRLRGQWHVTARGDDGQFTFGPDGQLVSSPRVWWESKAGCAYITINDRLHTVTGDKVDCTTFSGDLLEWLVDNYSRTMDHA